MFSILIVFAERVVYLFINLLVIITLSLVAYSVGILGFYPN